jgi:hypothetical protein
VEDCAVLLFWYEAFGMSWVSNAIISRMEILLVTEQSRSS